MVIDLEQLKARFAINDTPSSQDFEDLIDTLAAVSPGDVVTNSISDKAVTLAKLADGGAGDDVGDILQLDGDKRPVYATLAGGLPPTGNATGTSLSGTYPGPVIRSHASDDAQRAISADMIKSKAVTLAKLFTDGNTPNGASPVYSTAGGGSVAWSAPAAPGDAVTRQPVSGAVNVFHSAQTALVASVDQVITWPHGLGVKPTHANWVAVVLDAFANYVVGDEIPIDRFFITGSPAVRAFYDTSDAVNVHLRVELSAGTTTVYDKTSTGNTTAEIAAGNYAKIALVCHAYSIVSGDGFGSITQFAPVNQTIPALAATRTFTHPFGAYPASYKVSLVCVDVGGDAGYANNDEVGVDGFFDATGLGEAFAVKATTSAILVNRALTTIYVTNFTTQAIVAIDPTKWEIRVIAHQPVSVPTLIFPSLSFDVVGPLGFATYKDQAFLVHSNVYDVNGTSYLSQIDMATNRITRRNTFAAPFRGTINPALFKFTAAAKKRIVWSDSAGVFGVNVMNPADSINFGTNVETANFKPVWFDETNNGGTQTNPTIWLVNSNSTSTDVTGTGEKMSSLRMYKLLWNVSTYDKSTVGTVDFTNSGIAGIGGLNDYTVGAARILLFQYNQPANRIYIVDNKTGFLHIFTLAVQSLVAFFTAANYANLTYVKTITVPGACGPWTNKITENYFVEFDLDTGTEKAICVSRRGLTDLTGSVTRIPWRE